MKMAPNIIEVKNDKMNLQVLEGGDIYKVLFDNTMLNMYPGTSLDGSLYNLYLRVGGEFTQLIGVNSPSSFAVNKNQVIYKGSFNGVSYRVVFTVLADTWFVDVDLSSTSKEKVAVFYGFDVGLANEGINEAYNCQYIDHNVITRNNSFAILSKQNQGRPLLLETSSLDELDSYSTDGFQFFTNQYKIDNYPQALRKEHLDNENSQYELAFIAFKTKDEVIEKKHFTFYHHVSDNYYTFPSKEADIEEIKKMHEDIAFADLDATSFKKINLKYNYNHTYTSLKMSEAEIKNTFKELRNVEYGKDGQIYSFFSKNHDYVVTQDMELELQRPTGMVNISNGFKKIEQSPFAFTSYMYGVFASHIVLGNTDFNSFTSESKTPLNISKIHGLRIFVKLDGDYRLLDLPAAYKMSVSSATWYYKINDDLLTITSAISYDSNKIEIEVSSKNDVKYDLLITNYIHMGKAEPSIIKNNNSIIYYFNEHTMPYGKYNKFHYQYKSVNNPLSIYGDSFFIENATEDELPLMVHKIDSASNVKLLISADYNEIKEYDFEPISMMENHYYKNFMDNISNVDVHGSCELANKINDLTVWYVENALIHYASPHGLEQFSGAAWGCRDVCQGPLELFLTFGNLEIAKDILLKVYSRQFIHNFDWPQWFMFDEYRNIQAQDSHGDVIVWPLKAISEYIKRSNDLSILDEVVPYFDLYQGAPTQKVDTVFAHITNQLNAIKESFINGYNLSCYGGGDWDDTLQPKDKTQAKHMVSGWTIALTIDALQTFISRVDGGKYDITFIKDMLSAMKKDFENVIIKDDIPAGFINVNDNKVEYMLHPLDNKSHIRYRLLPLTRGMIGSIYSLKQVNEYLNIIDDNLMYSDGVRLMSDAIEYKGGLNTLFNRAETAANFGREIGLQYVHAHIRYCEAMAKIGANERLFDGINKIVPIKIKDYVSNAMTRQGNVYFSSSDGNFLNRYDACKNFNKLKSKEVDVKAGWRLYSSGPGIFLNQIYSHFLGISLLNKQLYIDPVLSEKMDNTVVSFNYNGRNVVINYHVSNANSSLKEVTVNGSKCLNHVDEKYRAGGILVDLPNDNNISIDVVCK